MSHGFLLDQHFEDVESLKEMVSDLVFPDGSLKPGVTKEQVLYGIKLLEDIQKAQQDCIYSLESMSSEIEEHAKHVEGTREFILDLEREYGVEFDPLLKRIYNM